MTLRHDVDAVIDHAKHTAYSDPGADAPLLEAVPPDIAQVSAVVRNVLVHYRASGHQLPETTFHEVHSRWLSVALDHDQRRHPWPLAVPREVTSRVQGCCRDHALWSVAVLRHHGIPARSRVGFADYFKPGWNHDHVVPEFWDDGRWHRFEPELDRDDALLDDPLDLQPGRGFLTAAEVWRGHRCGDLDAELFGVDVEVPDVRGAWMIRNYVILEVAHRFGDELLLWDNWGAMGGPGSATDDADLIDRVAALLVLADGGDPRAEQRLLELYRSDDRLHPGGTVQRLDFDSGGFVAERVGSRQ